jgi:hypothetical protein
MQSLPAFIPRGSHQAVSNTERQRQFRERNPGYYGRLHARRRAAVNARVACAANASALAEVPAVAEVAVAQRALVEALAAAFKPVLMLPAPVEDPMMAQLKALAASLKARSAAGALPLPLSLPALPDHRADAA